MSKTALLGLTKTLSQELAMENIRVNSVAPGIIKTKFAVAMYETDAAKETVLSFIPMKR